MLLQFVFCKLILFTLIYANNFTSSETGHDSKKVEVPKELQDLNKTEITMVSEGGAIVPIASTLSKAEPINFDTELDKTKERTVVPRKGVKYTPPDDDSTSLLSAEIKNNDKEEKNKNSNVVIPPKESKKLTASKTDKKNNIDQITDGKLNNTNKNTTNKVEKTLKPLVLSYEGLSEMDKLIEKDSTNKLHPEIKPNTDINTKIIRVQTVNASHPGMIMPVIITILTVPLFAVLGYLALKRGQEAWKNRHYKRMDFLLDGMYND